jgi:DNA-binding NtrC family response regulator
MSRIEDASPDDTVPLEQDAVSSLRGARHRISLVVYHRGGADVLGLHEGGALIVGRTRPSDLAIADASLSRQHARFTLSAGTVFVEDMGSTNGTLVNGVAVRGVTAVQPGDEVGLGAVLASVHGPALSGARPKGLEGHDRFQRALEDELERARHYGRKAALLLVRSGAGDKAHVGKFSARVLDRLRPVDRGGLYCSDTVEALLTETTLEDALACARAITAESSLCCGLAIFPDAATTADALLAATRRSLLQATLATPVSVAGSEGARTWMADATAPVVESAVMREVFTTVERLARSTIPVLIVGETGAGKEVVARRIHGRGARAGHPLISVNCGAIPAQLVESTLFGHEKGAFTGAVKQHEGVFEAAKGGTVLLDEIGELPAAAQAALLRVLEAKRITRVGGNREIDVDVRVLAATNRDLDEMCATGAFRTDLLYRLNAMTLRVPPLRERRDEIPAMIAHFMREAAAAAGAAHSVADEAMAALLAHAWPGNVRELKNAIERAVVIARADLVTVDDLPERVRGAVEPARSKTVVLSAVPIAMSGEAADFKTRMAQHEARVILDALEAANGVQTRAAALLGMPLRTLAHKMHALHIKKDKHGYRQKEGE